MQTLLSALAFKLFVRSSVMCCASDVCDVSVAQMENARSRLGGRKPRITPHHIRNLLILNNSTSSRFSNQCRVTTLGSKRLRS